jgi:hypothetical protein
MDVTWITVDGFPVFRNKVLAPQAICADAGGSKRKIDEFGGAKRKAA